MHIQTHENINFQAFLKRKEDNFYTFLKNKEIQHEHDTRHLSLIQTHKVFYH